MLIIDETGETYNSLGHIRSFSAFCSMHLLWSQPECQAFNTSRVFRHLPSTYHSPSDPTPILETAPAALPFFTLQLASSLLSLLGSSSAFHAYPLSFVPLRRLGRVVILPSTSICSIPWPLALGMHKLVASWCEKYLSVKF